MSDERTKPGLAYWATVVVAVLLLYPVGFGPACWWLSRPVTLSFVSIKARRAPAIYSPVGWFARRAGTGRIQTVINWYATAGVAKGEGIACGIQNSEDAGIVFMAR
jgi:hypothetical protein